MKNNATPRPWVIRPSRDTSGDVGITAEGLPNVIAETFADIRFRGEHNATEAKANAELIVTAVNARDGLMESVANLLSLVRAHTGPDDAIATAAIEKAEAALKLARAES